MTRYIEEYDITISHVLLTHWHKDHTGGVADLLVHNPNIQIFKHKPEPPQLGIQDGQEFATHGATLRAVLTPGHTTDHTCFVLEEENALFTGDNVLGHGYSVAENLMTYTASLRVMANLRSGVGYPGHGAVITNLPQTMSKYIAQRVMRENQIYGLLTSHTLPTSSCSTSSTNSVVSTGDGEEDDSEEICRGMLQGLSTAQIGDLLYGDISKDSITFDSAVKSLLNQVLYMLVERGKVGARVVGPHKTKNWFATF